VRKLSGVYGEGAGRTRLLNGVAGETSKLNESKLIAVEFEQGSLLNEAIRKRKNTRDLCCGAQTSTKQKGLGTNLRCTWKFLFSAILVGFHGPSTRLGFPLLPYYMDHRRILVYELFIRISQSIIINQGNVEHQYLLKESKISATLKVF